MSHEPVARVLEIHKTRHDKHQASRLPAMNAPSISICIANYNGAGLVGPCIDSVLSQSAQMNVEIIMHDDASTDGSTALVRSRYPGVRLIESRENVGFCVANNRMVAEAAGQYILLLNNDAELMPGALQALHEEAQRLGGAAILTLPQYDAASGSLIDRGCLLDLFFNPVPNLDPRRQDVAMTIGACLWMPRALWNDLGGFPDWFGSIGEDLYLCCLARLAGHPVRVLDVSGYRHRVGWSFGGGRVKDDGRLESTYRRRRLSERNKTYALIACYPSAWLWLVLPLHLVALWLEGIALALAKGKWAPWREIYGPLLPALLGNRNRLKALRREVQVRRRISVRDFFRALEFFPHKLRLLVRHGWPQLR